MSAASGDPHQKMQFLPSERKPWRVRTQLLVAVNVPLAVLLAILLTWDYQREISLATQTKHANLANEAVAIHRAVTHLLGENDEKGVQSYIDSVCHQMRSEGAEHHTIIVESRDAVFSSHGAHDSNRRLLTAIQAVSSPHVTINGQALIVGRHAQPGLTVYIAESLTTVRGHARRMLVGRIAALAVLGLVAIVLVNTVVLRIVGRPIRILVRAVDSVRNGDYIEAEGAFATREFRKLSAAISLMSSTLRENENHRTIQMEKAREIQQHLLPADIKVPGLSIATWFVPAERVAGDFYDIVPAPDGSWLIALADVSGHGVPSALEAAVLKVLLQLAANQTQDPAGVLRFVNAHFVDTVPEGDFASAFLMRWTPGADQFEYANAGHIPGLLRNPGGDIIELEATGSLLGIDKDADWETQTIPIHGSEELLIVSDGVIECRSESRELFGRGRLRELFKSMRPGDSEAVIEELQQEFVEFTNSSPLLDDTTAMAVEFKTASVDARTAAEPSIRETST